MVQNERALSCLKTPSVRDTGVWNHQLSSPLTADFFVTPRRVAAGDMLDDPAFGMHNCVMKLTLCIAAVAVAFGTTFYALTGWEELAMWFSAGLRSSRS